jgi:predicted HTH transcriptional regulator
LIDPPLKCRIQKLFIQTDNGDEKPIIKINIPKSIFVHKGPGGYFQRIGSSRREMPPDILARLFQQRSQNRLIRFDEQTVGGADLNSLHKDLWDRFKTPLSPPEDLEFLIKLKLASYDDDGAVRPTVSGLLMASEHPEVFIPNAYIQAVCYNGEQQNAEQLDAQDITGPLDMQIKNACKFVRGNMKTFAVKDPGRIEPPQYSMNAVFEALVNAAAHRDYSIYGSKIRLFIFRDRMELYSPGTILNTMTIESLPLRQSSRNELLSSLLARCRMNVDAEGSKRVYIMDKRGEGVPIILMESEKLSGIKPEYLLIDDTELRLTVFAARFSGASPAA